jgi:hypothetical protein
MATESKELHIAKIILFIGLSAFLYGFLGYEPLFRNVCPRALVLGATVMFWPAAIFPAIFGVLFGPLVGGTSAALGIFLSDMLLFNWNLTLYPHLSLGIAIGVVANFVCFYLVSCISRKDPRWTRTRFGYLGLLLSFVILGYISYLDTRFAVSIPPPYSSFGVINFGLLFLIVALGRFVSPDWKSYGVAVVTSKAIAGSIIGVGIWGISQFFVLPLGYFHLPFYVSLAWLAWTVSSESLFLLTVMPLVVKACYKMFPSLRPYKQEEISKT